VKKLWMLTPRQAAFIKLKTISHRPRGGACGGFRRGATKIAAVAPIPVAGISLQAKITTAKLENLKSMNENKFLKRINLLRVG
jgi:hypothetical protein